MMDLMTLSSIATGIGALAPVVIKYVIIPLRNIEKNIRHFAMHANQLTITAEQLAILTKRFDQHLLTHHHEVGQT